MPRCRGKTSEGTQCKLQAAEDDNRCLAHKLRTLPREVLKLIFEKIPTLGVIKAYSCIYSEALPAYFKRKLEVGTAIARELVEKYKRSRSCEEACLQDVVALVDSGIHENIDKAIWRMLIQNEWHYHEKRVFTLAWQYCELQFRPTIHSDITDLIYSAQMRISIRNCSHAFDCLTTKAKKDIEVMLLSMGAGFSITVKNQMAILLHLIRSAFNTADGDFFTTADYLGQVGLRLLVTNICEIKPYGQSLVSLPAYQAIWK